MLPASAPPKARFPAGLHVGILPRFFGVFVLEFQQKWNESRRNYGMQKEGAPAPSKIHCSVQIRATPLLRAASATAAATALPTRGSNAAGRIYSSLSSSSEISPAMA